MLRSDKSFDTVIFRTCISIGVGMIPHTTGRHISVTTLST